MKLEGTDTNELLEFLNGKSITYEKHSEEFQTWIEATVLTISVAASLFTIVDILKEWTRNKSSDSQTVNLTVNYNGTVINLDTDYPTVSKQLDSLLSQPETGKNSSGSQQ